MVAGSSAASNAAPLLNILRTEPELFAEVWAVTYQSERRWDVHLRNGIRVRLPETDPRTAWSRLAVIDHSKRIIDRDLAVIDMRVPDQMIVEPNIPVRGKERDMRLGSRRNSHKPFAILDIGSSKICCMIGEIDKLGTLSLIGQGTHASAGMRAGEVNVLSEFSDAIGNCVQSAERTAGLSITSVSVVMPGGRPHSAFGTQHMTLSDSTVSRRDIRGLLDRCGAQALDPALQLMFHPLHYSLDEMRGIADPTGMRGKKLSVDYLTVAARASLSNITEALALNHLRVDRFIRTGYAAGLTALARKTRAGLHSHRSGGGTPLRDLHGRKLIYSTRCRLAAST